MRLLTLAGAGLLALGLTISSSATPSEGTPDPAVASDAVAALNEGNRLYRNGQVEEAVEAYRAGYSPGDPHPTLVYNLATALHHLDRLPEAVLWYRRAGGSGDPWLEENLWLARRGLGSQSLPPGGLLGHMAPWTGVLRWCAVGLVWAGLVLFLLGSRVPLWTVVTAAAVAVALFAAALAVESWGPRPAVLLEDCRTSLGEVPAGTEAWVHPLDDGRYLIDGSQLICSPEAVELVFPDRGHARMGSIPQVPESL